MAAALITPVDWTLLHNAPRLLRLNKVTQNDWIYLPDVGTTNPVIQNYAGTVGTFTFGTATIYNESTAYGTTTEEIVVVGAPIDIYDSDIYRVPFYIETTGGEYLQVIQNTPTSPTAATWTVVRGCLGTTASATGLTHASSVYIKNVLTLTDAGTGYVTVTYNPLPEDPKTNIFG